MTLEQLTKQMEGVAGQWNGEDSGIQEEQAGVALDVIEKIKDIEQSLTYLDELDSHLWARICLLYTSPSPRDGLLSRMPSSA